MKVVPLSSRLRPRAGLRLIDALHVIAEFRSNDCRRAAKANLGVGAQHLTQWWE